MSGNSLSARLAVCSWSLRPDSPQTLASGLAALDIPRTQLALDPVRTSENWRDAGEILVRGNITIVSGMFGCIGEDYSTLESIRRTGGIVPDETWADNWANIRENAGIARDLGMPLVTFHAGFLPEDTGSPKSGEILNRIRKIADCFGERGMAIAFETGQETPELLREYLEKLDYPNVGVNFDPANMLIYNTGHPVDSVRLLAPWLRQVHIKDAVRPSAPGGKGAEALAGEGDVPWPEFFTALRDLDYNGALAIERENGDRRQEDIATARDLVLRQASL